MLFERSHHVARVNALLGPRVEPDPVVNVQLDVIADGLDFVPLMLTPPE